MTASDRRRPPVLRVVADVALTTAPPDLQARGLLGWASFRHGVLRLDGVAVRRTRDGRLVLSFPVRHDRAGRQHDVVRPADATARRTIEADVLAAVADRLPGPAGDGGDSGRAGR
ncbi:MAG: hypothetical protein ACF8XB_19595 [Planctomycetota bacterium JB042]